MSQGFGLLEKKTSSRLKKKGGEGSKSDTKRHHPGEQTDIFGEKKLQITSGGKNTSSDSSIIVLSEHSGD